MLFIYLLKSKGLWRREGGGSLVWLTIGARQDERIQLLHMQIIQVWLHQTMHSLMRIVGCLYLCLDMFLKGRLFPDKAEFNKEVFHYSRWTFAYLSLSFSPSLCCTLSFFQSLAPVIYSLLLSNSTPTPCPYKPLSDPHGYSNSFFFFSWKSVNIPMLLTYILGVCIFGAN